MGKTPHSVYLDDDLCKKARDLGLNISRICEIALRDAVLRMMAKEEER